MNNALPLLSRLRACVTIIALTLIPFVSTAQKADRVALRITDLDVENVDSPQYSIEGGIRLSKDNLEWTRIEITYETRRGEEGWIDELQFNWNILIMNGSTPRILLKRNVTYLDISEEQNKHHAVIYMRPRAMRRYYDKSGDVKERDVLVHVEAVVDGRVIAEYNHARGTVRVPDRWWTFGKPQVNSIEGVLLTRIETPFAPLMYNYYEYIKPETR